SCTELFYNDRRAELYDVLAGILPPSLARFFLCNSGTEAVEGALKFARAATKRTGIVATMRGFHGKTMGALSATWGPEYRDLFGPLVPDFSHVPFNKPEALDAAITERTAAFIVEIVEGEGGVRPATREFAQEAARLCAARGALLIVDEVQTGFGRTGTLFAIEQYGLMPDILCLAKSIAGGMPMGAIAFSRKIGDLAKRSHSTTFGGNPLACAAAIAAIGEIQRLDLARNARERGAQLVARMAGRGFRANVDDAGNAVGEIGDGPVHVVLLGHIDTVPGEIPVRIEGDELVGRGAVDAKGPLAAFIAAATQPIPGVRVTVVGAVEEESPSSKGARHRATLAAPDWCVIGEPSGWDAVTVAYKGRLTLHIAPSREARHGSAPGATVAEEALALWERVRESTADQGSGNRSFERLDCRLESIEAGSADG